MSFYPKNFFVQGKAERGLNQLSKQSRQRLGNTNIMERKNFTKENDKNCLGLPIGLPSMDRAKVSQNFTLG